MEQRKVGNCLGKTTGITLVALVVTIIVLLILAGVSINLVAGSNGILGKAQKAVDVNNMAQIKEEIELKIAELEMDYYMTENNFANANDYVKSELEKGVELPSGAVITTDSSGNLNYDGMQIGILNPDGSVTIDGELSGSQIITKYTVSYNANGGTGVPVSKRYAVGENVSIDFGVIPTREKFVFLGWATSSTAIVPEYTEERDYFLMENRNINLYAVWAEAEASIGNTYFASIGDAVKIAPDYIETTVNLLKNTTTTLNITIAESKNIVLDLNHFSITNNTDYHVIMNRGKLLIKNGNIVAEGNNYIVRNYNNLTIESGVFESKNRTLNLQEGSKTTILGGEFIAKETTSTIYVNNNCELEINNSAVIGNNEIEANAISNHGTTKILGGTLNTKRIAIYNTGSCIMSAGVIMGNSETVSTIENDGGIFEMSGGKITSANETGIRNMNGGKCSLTGGKVTAVKDVTLLNQSDCITEISGLVEIAHLGDENDKVCLNNFGELKVNGGTIITENSNTIYNREGGTCTINNGTILGRGNYPTIYNKGDFRINGGTVTNESGNKACYNAEGGSATYVGGVCEPRNF